MRLGNNDTFVNINWKLPFLKRVCQLGILKNIFGQSTISHSLWYTRCCDYRSIINVMIDSRVTNREKRGMVMCRRGWAYFWRVWWWRGSGRGLCFVEYSRLSWGVSVHADLLSHAPPPADSLTTYGPTLTYIIIFNHLEILYTYTSHKIFSQNKHRKFHTNYAFGNRFAPYKEVCNLIIPRGMFARLKRTLVLLYIHNLKSIDFKYTIRV